MSVVSLALMLIAAVAANGQTTSRTVPVPRSVVDACGLAYRLARGAAGASASHRIGTFVDERVPLPLRGCEVRASGSFKRAKDTGDAVGRVRDGFADRGWEPLPGYDADGKDGTAFAFQKNGIGCLIRGEWDGGADGEPETPPEDWYRLTVVCTSPVPTVAG